MKKVHFDIPDEPAFLDEVLRSVENAPDQDAKIKVLTKAFMAFRGFSFAQAALMLDEAPPAREDAVTELLTGAAMYYPEGEWRRFGELLYPKEGPMWQRVVEAANKRTGPR